MRHHLLPVLALSALLAAACSGAPAPPTAAPASPSIAPTLAPTPTPTPSPTPTPTATPTATPTPTTAPTDAPQPPTASPSVTTAPGTEAPFPNEAEALLISYVSAAFQSTCERAGPIYPVEVASITCGPDDLPFTYTQFGEFSDMAEAYNRDLRLGPPAQPDGTCSEANSEAPYEVDGVVAGRLSCREHESSSTGALYHDMEWTRDGLLLIGYISNRADLRSWDDLIVFWQEQAGPFAPD